MNVLLGLIGGKVGAFALGAVIPLVFVLVKKYIPAQLGKALSGALAKEMKAIGDIKDPKLKALVMALAVDLVKIAEYELPDPGQGAERYKRVAAKLCEMLPILKGQDKRIEELIEAAVNAMDAELKKNIPA